MSMRRPGYTKEYYAKNRDKIRERNKAWRAANPEKMRAYKLKHRTGLTLEEYDAMLEKQGGVCAICKNTLPKRIKRGGEVKLFCVDHDHKTGENRGLLCDDCNLMLGFAKDRVEILEAAIEYLKEYK